MDDKDRVFANFKDDQATGSEKRELLTIPRRAGAVGTRAVEVVRVRSGGGVKAASRRLDRHVRAASWEDGFPVKTVVAPLHLEPAPAEATQEPTAHVMPAWEPAAEVASAGAAEEFTAAPRRGWRRPRKHPSLEPAGAHDGTAVAEDQIDVSRRGPGRPCKVVANAPARRVADPFDIADDGANCMRCGYAIEPTREKRGLMTCLACG